MDALPPLEIPKQLGESIIEIVKPMGITQAQILWEKGDIIILSDSGKKCRLVLDPKLPSSGQIEKLPSIQSLNCYTD